MRLRRTPRPGFTVANGEKVLAWAASGDDGVVAGTRDALYLPDGHRIAWQQLEAADWDLEEELLQVTEVGTWGEPRPAYALPLSEPGLLLQLVRERVTSTILMQRHVAVRAGRGVRVVARRAPTGDRAITWFFSYDDGVDPDDPLVEHAAQEALAAARDEVGDR